MTVYVKHAFRLGVDITFIDCSSFGDAKLSDVKCASTMNTIDMFWMHSFWFQTFRSCTIVFNFWSCLILLEIIFVSRVCCSCGWISCSSSFNVQFSMSGTMMSSSSSLLVYSSNWSVSLNYPEMRSLRIQLPEGSLIRFRLSISKQRSFIFLVMKNGRD